MTDKLAPLALHISCADVLVDVDIFLKVGAAAGIEDHQRNHTPFTYTRMSNGTVRYNAESVFFPLMGQLDERLAEWAKQHGASR